MPEYDPAQVPTVLTLADPGARDAALAGHKAATLSALHGSGFGVPPGVVVTAGAAQSDSAAVQILAALPKATSLAVRSSAADEDTMTSSAAGRYRTVLDVPPQPDALTAAIRDVVASGAGRPIAVLVQPMIQPRVAGVAFGADPVTGDVDAVRIEAVRGLADRLVGGHRDGARWTVTAGSAPTAGSPDDPVLTADEARHIYDVIRELGHRLGSPQDIEWAIDDVGFHLLQARPVTALPAAPTIGLPAGTWVFDRHRYPNGMTPFGLSIAIPAVSDGLTAAFARCGALIERVDMHGVAGYPYLRFTPVGGRGGPPPPAWLLGLVSRIAPRLRTRCRRARDLLASGDLEADIEHWNTVQRDRFRRRAAELRRVDPAALTGRELREYIAACLVVLRDGLAAHFHLMPAHVVGVYRLIEVCARLLGWDMAAALTLLTGSSSASDEPTRELRAIARRVADRIAANPAAWHAFSAPSGTGDLHAADPDGAAEFDAWYAVYGLRTVNDDPGSVTLAEIPGLLPNVLRAHLCETDEQPRSGAATPDAARRSPVDVARAQLAAHPDSLAEFDTTLAAATGAYAVREDNVLWALSIPAGLVRRALVETGRRLHRRGLIDNARDIVFLDVDAVTAALARVSGDAAAPTAVTERLRDAVRAAKAERAWVASHPLPDYFGPPPTSPPDVRFLPAAARTVNAALLLDRPDAGRGASPEPVGAALIGSGPTGSDAVGSGPSHAATVLTGIPGSAGRYTGPARIVGGPADFAMVRPGDVLVCPVTDPVWSVLFGIAGALVTDGGGALCHAAIIAREHGIPAVLATGDATTRLMDGQVITVDGAAGTVTLPPSRSTP